MEMKDELLTNERLDWEKQLRKLRLRVVLEVEARRGNREMKEGTGGSGPEIDLRESKDL